MGSSTDQTDATLAALVGGRVVAAWAGGSVDTDGTSVQGTGLELQRNSTDDDLANRLLGDGRYGHAGNDTLLGLGGDDIRYGGLGDDSYSIGIGLAKVIEANGQGTDRVISRVSHALGANTEVRHLMGQDAINDTGSGLARARMSPFRPYLQSHTAM